MNAWKNILAILLLQPILEANQLNHGLREFLPQILRALLAHSNIPGCRTINTWRGYLRGNIFWCKRNKEAPKVFHNHLLYIYDHNPCWCVNWKYLYLRWWPVYEGLSKQLLFPILFNRIHLGFLVFLDTKNTKTPSQHHAKLVFGVTDSLRCAWLR